MAEIRINSLTKNFGDFVAVRQSSFTIENSEFFVMLGPSGCGKTTTLRMIAGLEIPSAGEVLLDGEDVTYNPASKRDIAFVFQLFALYPHMNVEKNISFPLRLQKMSRKNIRAKTLEVAKMLRIDHLLKSPVGGLSSGDRQRVALGRALVRDAKAFLMDEPLGALDAEFRDLMCEELRLLHKKINATTVYVTHDQVEAMSMADRVCIMNEGEVLQVGTPKEVYQHPATKFVAGFVGSPSMNFLQVTGNVDAGATQVGVAGGVVPVPALHEVPSGSKLWVGARPEHITLVDDGDVRGRVFSVEYMGARQLVILETESGRLRVRTHSNARIRRGDAVGLSFDRDSLTVFDGETDRALESDANREVRYG